MENKKVIKRDGKEVEFDIQKIIDALKAAFKACNYKIAEEKIEDIAYEIPIWDKIHVEQIQDQVEEILMSYQYFDVAKEYVLYRKDRELIRQKRDLLTQQLKAKLEATNVVNQNANVDEHSFGGRIGEASRIVTKNYALDYCMSEMARNNHLNNEIYIHDLDSYAVGMHNCFNGSTKLITSEGVKSFNSFVDGQLIQVVNKNGNWVDGIIRQYEKQKMYNLTFTSGLTNKVITCTRDHRWILEDGTITNNIQIGDKLLLTPEIDEFNLINKYWCFGFILGDGCDYNMYSKDKTKITNSGMQVRLCSDKIQYLKNFIKAGFSIRQQHSNGDITLHTRGNGAYKQNFLTSKMWNILDKNALASIFEGYFAADGCLNGNSISTTDSNLADFIKHSAPLAGYHIWSYKEHFKSTNYKKDVLYYEFHLCKKQSNKHPWILSDIKVSKNGENGFQTAWCVEVEDTHSFILDGCMVTGNCLSIPFDDLLANGFNTRQTDVRPANSINTAFQLVAVIFQLQSLQQFGR